MVPSEKDLNTFVRELGSKRSKLRMSVRDCLHELGADVKTTKEIRAENNQRIKEIRGESANNRFQRKATAEDIRKFQDLQCQIARLVRPDLLLSPDEAVAPLSIDHNSEGSLNHFNRRANVPRDGKHDTEPKDRGKP